MNVLICKQEAIDALCELYEYQRAFDPTEAADLVRQGIYLAEKKIERLPSVDRTGEWEHDVDGHFFCTNCKKYPEYQIRMSDYCPNCGADMRGGNDEIR